jgi:thiol:disulfide interchange protein
LKNILFLFFASLLIFTSCKGSKQATAIPTTGIKFSNSKMLSTVLDQAVEKDKLVFVDVYTTWCMPCKMMDEDVFPDANLGNYFNENFISMKVDAEKGTGPTIATLFGIYAYPTLLFLDSKGNVLEQKVGAAYHTEMMNLATSAVSKKPSIQ